MQEEGDICITISPTPPYTFLLLQATSTFSWSSTLPLQFHTFFCSYPFAIVPFYTTYSAHTLSHPTHSTLVSNTVPLPFPPAPSSVPLKTNITSLSKEASMWSLWVLSMNSFSVSAWGCGMKFNTQINNTYLYTKDVALKINSGTCILKVLSKVPNSEGAHSLPQI